MTETGFMWGVTIMLAAIVLGIIRAITLLTDIEYSLRHMDDKLRDLYPDNVDDVFYD